MLAPVVSVQRAVVAHRRRCYHTPRDRRRWDAVVAASLCVRAVADRRRVGPSFSGRARRWPAVRRARARRVQRAIVAAVPVGVATHPRIEVVGIAAVRAAVVVVIGIVGVAELVAIGVGAVVLRIGGVEWPLGDVRRARARRVLRAVVAAVAIGVATHSRIEVVGIAAVRAAVVVVIGVAGVADEVAIGVLLQGLLLLGLSQALPTLSLSLSVCVELGVVGQLSQALPWLSLSCPVGPGRVERQRPARRGRGRCRRRRRRFPPQPESTRLLQTVERRRRRCPAGPVGVHRQLSVRLRMPSLSGSGRRGCAGSCVCRAVSACRPGSRRGAPMKKGLPRQSSCRRYRRRDHRSADPD